MLSNKNGFSPVFLRYPKTACGSRIPSADRFIQNYFLLFALCCCDRAPWARAPREGRVWGGVVFLCFFLLLFFVCLFAWFGLYIPITVHHGGKLRQKLKQGRNLEAVSMQKIAHWLALHKWLMILIQNWSTRLRVARPAVGWALVHPSLIQKMPPQSPLLSYDINLYQVDNTSQCNFPYNINH